MQYLVGKTVRFLGKIEEMEANCDPNQRARIVSVREEDTNSLDKYEHVYVITFDYSEFEEYNDNFASSNYYDKDQRPILTAREAGQYSTQEDVYFGSPDIWPFEDYFTPLGDKAFALIEKFKQSGETNYIAWLENQVET